MATEEIEHYTDAQTVAAALYGDRNYIAAYESIGKSYTVTLDSADAQNAGTTGIMASYHSPLPDIAIPVRDLHTIHTMVTMFLTIPKQIKTSVLPRNFKLLLILHTSTASELSWI